ncbi:hypothetical protein ONA00_00335 [Mycoplasmopsis cynos]|uniref:hypothetical protein n=1 Tax=Mycoplasmopsis cynos TaxID=171284 RepID=UPI0024C5250A|nr:hypothetical protein [Mycoplasmopsis cynos]WAM10995.1 hypothetical protein ONA00_00335 [Mycoplasmopsis cynos]
MKDKKIDYTVIGSWDSQNSEKSAGVRSFFNVVKTDEKNEYLQGRKPWAYGINARNNGAKPERRTALREFLKAIFKAESYKEYFLSDSKIPFTNKFQTDLANDLRNENDNAVERLIILQKNLNLETIQNCIMHKKRNKWYFWISKTRSNRSWLINRKK